MVVEPNGHEVVIGKCGTCSQTIRGSRNVTSNFVTHVKVCCFYLAAVFTFTLHNKLYKITPNYFYLHI